MNAPWLEALPDLAAPSLESDSSMALDSLRVHLRFSGPIAQPPSGAEASLSSEALIFVEINEEGMLERIPYEARLSEEDKTSISDL